MEAPILASAVDDEVRDVAQPPRALAERRERIERVAEELVAEPLRIGQPHEARVGWLAARLVLAGGLSERHGIGFLVEDIVYHLKRETHAFGIPVEAVELHLSQGRAAVRAHQ